MAILKSMNPTIFRGKGRDIPWSSQVFLLARHHKYLPIRLLSFVILLCIFVWHDLGRIGGIGRIEDGDH